MKLIRSTRHKLHVNAKKSQQLNTFVGDYKNFVGQLIDYVWAEGYLDYCPSRGLFKAPKFFDSTFLSMFETGLGGM